MEDQLTIVKLSSPLLVRSNEMYAGHRGKL